jgi:hypothetical protein
MLFVLTPQDLARSRKFISTGNTGEVLQLQLQLEAAK